MPDGGNKGAFVQSYNAQLAVDAKSQVIVAMGLTQEGPDQNHLVPMVDEIERELGRLPPKLLSDAGYFSEAAIRSVQARGVEVYCPPDSWRATDRGPCPRGRPPRNETFKQLIGERDHRSLIDYPALGKAVQLAVPTPEHFLPMLYALALQEPDEEVLFFNDVPVAGSLTMTSFVIGQPNS